MTTKLDRDLKREIEVGGQAYTVTMTREGLKLTLKGHRKGREWAWKDLVGSDGNLTPAVNASLEQPQPASNEADDPDQ